LIEEHINFEEKPAEHNVIEKKLHATTSYHSSWSSQYNNTRQAHDCIFNILIVYVFIVIPHKFISIKTIAIE